MGSVALYNRFVHVADKFRVRGGRVNMSLHGGQGRADIQASCRRLAGSWQLACILFYSHVFTLFEFEF